MPQSIKILCLPASSKLHEPVTSLAAPKKDICIVYYSPPLLGEGHRVGLRLTLYRTWPTLTNRLFCSSINQLGGQTCQHPSQVSIRGWKFVRRKLTMKKLDEMTIDEVAIIIRAGAEVFNEYLKENDSPTLDLDGIDLSGADLTKIVLAGCNLRGANFANANLRHANLGASDLCEANFHNANLQGARLSSANLKDANMEGASLIGADLTFCHVYGVRASASQLAQTNLFGAKGFSITPAAQEIALLVVETLMDSWARMDEVEGISEEEIMKFDDAALAAHCTKEAIKREKKKN
ncbi:pentapeptide repeat-containing protein [Patescibacteria group bacterium]|nr:MAG: pentapeptide repeat-containing protein [Patescibacteria group bacterium]